MYLTAHFWSRNKP